MSEPGTVLVIDDEESMLDSCKQALVKSGYRVELAKSGEEGLKKVEEVKPDLALIDLKMPGISGMDVLLKMKELDPTIAKVVITGYATVDSAVEAMKREAFDFLTKPFTPDELRSAVSRGIEKHKLQIKLSAVRRATMKIVKKNELLNFVNNLIERDARTVVGVKSKGDKFVFDTLNSADELRLDYDVTILPPKKYFFPQRETLISYEMSNVSAEGNIEIEPRILFGVHPYDIVALLHMDEVFKETNSDPYYLKKRESSIIIGVNMQNISKWCFAGSMGCATIDHGYDLMLTDLGDRYAIDIGSKKGEELLAEYMQELRDAYAYEVQIVGRKKHQIMNIFEQRLDFSIDLLPDLLKKNYENSAFWEEHSEKCLSCGSCVLVCPTCYCFDVREDTDLSLQRGERIRTWDACILEDFAKVASGENFRPTKATRYRHRYNKKSNYLFDRFGFVSCVGCGRCASNCLPDIANPVKLFNDMYHEAIESEIELTPSPVSEISIQTQMDIDFVPKLATIVKKTPMTQNETLFELQLDNISELGHKPGQFVEVSIFGVGEAPISITSSPTNKETFELCVRSVGNVTNKLHTMNVGDKVGIRGPFGNGFDVDLLKGKDLLFIAGGLGIAPARSLLNYVLDKRPDFGNVTVLYGCKEPCELLFPEEIESWNERDDIIHKLTVDKCSEDECWEGNIGVITTLIPGIDFDPDKTYAVVVGPPIMYKFVITSLIEKDLPEDHIILSLERRMRCGVGKCGHCQIGSLYVCKDGPVFNYADIKDLPEALE